MAERQVIEITENTITSYEVWIHRDEQGRVVWRREVIVTRDSKGRFVTWKYAELYRVAVTIRAYPIHNKYYDYTLFYYHYDKDKIKEKIDELKEEAIKGAERYIHYPYEEWWAVPAIKISDIEPIEFDARLINTYDEEWKIHTG